MGGILIDLLPDNSWQKIVMFAQITKYSYEIKFWVKNKNTWKDCFNIIPRQQLRDSFKEIYDILLPDQKDKNWYSLTYILDNDGKVVVDYEYNDYSKFPYLYEQSWKKKYLK